MKEATPKLKKFAPFAIILFTSLWFLVLLGSPVAQQNQSSWAASSHDRTNFPLIGNHRTLSCRECHLKGVFEGTPTTCEACHWVRRQDDRYKLQLGLHCGDCHVPQSWKDLPPAKWNHSAVTGFKLEGAHRLQDCADCHGEQGLKKASVECYSCHEENYKAAKEPDHLAAQFPTQCQFCHHGTMTWEGAVFDHKFPLEAKHKLAACADCHKNGQYAGLSSACVLCHLNDYSSTTNPNHKQAGFPTDCVICHGQKADSWENAGFVHNNFALKGKHSLAACTDCHKNGQYAGLSSACVFCHLSDYNKTNDPNHRQAGYSTDCVPCHGDGAVSWGNANANHDQYWPLQGAHKPLNCDACHSRGYNLPKDCYGCHASDYNNATAPNHKSAGFPTTCETCHYPTHTAWSQAVFSHNFPIQSGKHSSFTCSDCHLTPNFSQFSCIDCHTHDRNTTDSKHGGVGGYSYNSLACYTCHPRGQAGG